jgi:hypothetical protein
MDNDLNKIQKTSILLIVSLFLPLGWYLIPEGYVYPFPLFEKQYPLRDIYPYFSQYLVTCIYVLAFNIVSKELLRNPIIGYLWYYYAIFEALKFIDFVLVFHQTPFRTTSCFIILSVTLYHLYYIYNNQK